MKKILIMAALLATAMVTSVFAQDGGTIRIPAGEQVVCVLECHGIIFIQLEDGSIIELPADASGTATLESLGENNQQEDGGSPASTAFKFVDITVSGTDATYGNYTFTFDLSATTTNTVITANQAGADFPATADVYANVTGEIDAFQGPFTNTTECHMRTTNLNSFAPQQGEVYTFVNDVVFTNEAAGGNISFTIPAGATITLN